MRAWSCVVLVVAACGGSGIGSGDDAQPDAMGSGSADAMMEEPWELLIDRSWSLQPVVEAFKCVSKQVTTDTYIRGFRQIAPTGTHHGILTVSSTPFTGGSYDCTAADNSKQMLYGGGIGTQEFRLPAGVAIKLPAGSYLNLNLHVANLSDDPLSGTSGIEVLTMTESEVVHEADVMFVGRFQFNDIPPDSKPHTVLGGCSIPTTWNVFSMWPHMHSYATKQRVFAIRDGTTVEETILDVPYSYEEQKNYAMPVALQTNDQMLVQCTYVNDTNVTSPPGYSISASESAAGEMCMVGLYKYPKGGSIYLCTDQPGS
jgi:hypothetical protein